MRARARGTRAAASAPMCLRALVILERESGAIAARCAHSAERGSRLQSLGDAPEPQCRECAGEAASMQAIRLRDKSLMMPDHDGPGGMEM